MSVVLFTVFVNCGISLSLGSHQIFTTDKKHKGRYNILPLTFTGLTNQIHTEPVRERTR